MATITTRARSRSALTGPEREQVLAVLDDDRFADKAPEQVWAVILDEGRYLCSVSTMYRILHSHSQIRERRAQAKHPPRIIPELVATGPDQVFSCYAEVVVMPMLRSDPCSGAVSRIMRSA